MYKLTEIIKKNLKLLLRSKSSALIVLLGPLLLILLISMAFNTTSLYDLKIGAYSGSYSDLSNSIIEKLNENEFNAVKIPTKDGCINSIKSNDIHVCAVFPDNLDVNSEKGIEFYVDKSRINLVYIIINSISTKVSTKSAELSTALTSALLNSINNADSRIGMASGEIIELSTDLKGTKSGIDEIKTTLSTSLNETTNMSELSSKADELNLTGEAGDLVGSYRSLTNSLVSKLKNAQSSSSKLNDLSSSLEIQIQGVNEISNVLSEVKDNFNSIEIREVSKIVSPISTEIKPISSESTHFDYTFPSLLVIVLLFSGLLIASTTIIEEKSSKVFFSNTILPLETLPLAIRSIAGYNPFILGVDALKEILLFKAPLTGIAMQFYTLLAYLAVLIVLVYVVRFFMKRRYIE